MLALIVFSLESFYEQPVCSLKCWVCFIVCFMTEELHFSAAGSLLQCHRLE